MSSGAFSRLASLLVLVSFVTACGGRATGEAAKSDTRASGGGAGLRALWLGQEGIKRLKLLDANSNEDLAQLDLPGDPVQLALGGDSVWVAIEDGPLVRVNSASRTIVASIDRGGKASGVAADSGSVWATHEGGGSIAHPEVVRIDPATNTVVKRVKVGDVNDRHTGIVVRGGNVCVLVGKALAVARIDAASGTVAERVLLGQAGGYGEFAVTEQAIYVVDEYSNVLHTLAPAPLAVRTQLPLGKKWSGWWAADARALYFANVDEERVLVLNPADASVRREFPLGSKPRTMQIAGNRLVVAVRGGDSLIFDTGSGSQVAELPGNAAVAIAAD